ncbi:hypothetical protein AYI70_g483 [Smittium culicis]|uniref:Altered inheritance of mitochondria protein 24, mitochondrial n=1 Tax=Smittium culicis TaxID=133412 RepID=A0A1R1YGP3_9FUNG|nr:hypothetical protein AYI70_g483 [Smittium culicis]
MSILSCSKRIEMISKLGYTKASQFQLMSFDSLIKRSATKVGAGNRTFHFYAPRMSKMTSAANLREINAQQNNQIENSSPASQNLSVKTFISDEEVIPIEQPKFERLESAFGSMVLAKLPPQSQFVLVNGRIVSKSILVQATETIDGNVLIEALNVLMGNKIRHKTGIFMPETQTGACGDLVFAPNLSGDIVEIKLNGLSTFLVSRMHLLAYTNLVSTKKAASLQVNSKSSSSDIGDINVMWGKTGGTNGYVTATGEGSLLISSNAGLFKLKLVDGEEYMVDSSHVVCWNSTVTQTINQDAPVIRKFWKSTKVDHIPSKSNKPSTSSQHPQENIHQSTHANTATSQQPITSASKPYSSSNAVKNFASRAAAKINAALIAFFKNLSSASLNLLSDTLALIMYKLKSSIKNGYSSPKLITIKGPGEVYLTSKSRTNLINRVKQKLY